MAEQLDFSASFRSSRIIRLNQKTDTWHDLTLFLGVYNAVDFVSDLEAQLRAQSDQRFNLVIANNASTDETLSQVLGMVERLENPSIVVSNPVNVGFHGSLMLNLDLLKSTWVGFMNQDDVYLPNHVSAIKKLAEQATETTVILSSGLGSMSSSGKRLGSPPRASWLFPENPRQSELIAATIALHVIPEPSIAYRVSVISEIAFPWHSTAFPDTELMLNALTMGGGLLSNEETVLYRESEDSASHHLTSEQRKIGAAVSLMRFLTGSRLKNFELALSLEERSFLLDGIISGLEARLGHTREFACVVLAYLETRVNESSYTDDLANFYLAGIYSSIGGSRAEGILGGIQKLQGNFVHGKRYGFDFEKSSPQPGRPSLLMFFQKATRHLNPTISRALGKLVLMAVSQLPGYKAWKIKKFTGRS